MTVSSPAEGSIETHGLRRLGGRPSFGAYLRQLWSRRWFGIELARARFRSANEQDRLGIGWIVLRPLINAVVYGTVFGLLLPSSTRPPNFPTYLVIGVFIFQYFASCLSDGARSITGNRGLVRSLHFPRALLPLASVLENLFAVGPMLVVIAALALATGEPLAVSWLLVVPAIMLMTLFNAGVALIAARLTIHIRDIAQLLPFLTRVLFYTSGIFFSVDRVTSDALLTALLRFSPVHVYINLIRGAVMETETAQPVDWLAGGLWALTIFVIGFLFSWRGEERYGRD